MCLAIPGRVTEVFVESGLSMGRLDYAGATGIACLECVPEVTIGQYVIVHAGFAISVVDEDEARKIYDLYAEASEGDDPGESGS